MYLFHNIGPRWNSNYNTLDEILSLPKDAKISFDGLYKSVHRHRERLHGRDIIIFVCGDHTGGDNSFDQNNLPSFQLEHFCDWSEIMQFCIVTGAKLGWHSWSHKNLCTLTDEEVKKEVTAPIKMDWFAYPYGNVDNRVAKIVEEAGYRAAWSVTQGNGSMFQQTRRYLNW